MGKPFNITFTDTEGNEKGSLIIHPDKPMRFRGEVDESANIFFNHLKKKIDAYVLDVATDDCEDCPDKTPPMI